MTDNPLVQRMKDAAFERWQEDGAKRREVEAIVLGPNAHSRDRLGEVVPFGDDWLVEVTSGTGDKAESLWTSVVGGKKTHARYWSQEHAVLNLIARRYTESLTDSHSAAVYAGRVLGIPEN